MATRTVRGDSISAAYKTCTTDLTLRSRQIRANRESSLVDWSACLIRRLHEGERRNGLHETNRVSAPQGETKPLLRVSLNAVGIRNVRMMRVLEEVALAFNEADTPVLVMKGAALHLQGCADVNERSLQDLDLLVHPEDLEKATKLLESVGANRGESLVQEDFCPKFHYEVEFSIGDIYPVKIDLHVRPFRPLRFAQTVPPEALWNRAEAMRIGRATVWVPGADDMVVHLCTHAAIHGKPEKKWLRDIEVWINNNAERINWQSILDTAKDWKLVHPVRRGLRLAARETGLMIPDDVSPELDLLPVGWRDRLTLWQSPRDAEHPVAHVLISAICTPGLFFAAAFVLAMVLPNRRHMNDWYRFRHWGWLPCAHLLRWIRPIASRIPILRKTVRKLVAESVLRRTEAAS